MVLVSLNQNQKAMDIKDRLAEIEVGYSPKIKKEDRIQVKTSEESYEVLLAIYDKETLEYQEFFIVLFLNRANEMLGYRCISKGGLAGTVVDIRQLLGIALKCNAAGIILSHNHPSGSLKPSNDDIELTRKIKEGSALLDVRVLDHLIISVEGYYSFADEGLL